VDAVVLDIKINLIIMLVSQVLIAFETIRKFPGQDLEGLAEKIHDTYGDLYAARFLIHGDLKYTLLPKRIKEIKCIDEKDGRFYYNPNIKPYSKDIILNNSIKKIIEE
jgi:hypothetical protein